MTYEEKVKCLQMNYLSSRDCTIHDMFRFIRDKYINNFFSNDSKGERYEVWLVPTVLDYYSVKRIINFDTLPEKYIARFTLFAKLIKELIDTALDGSIQIIYLDNKRYRFVAEVVETNN